MALRIFKCPACGHVRETLRNKTPRCNHGQEEEGSPFETTEMEQVVVAPNQKFMVTANEFQGTSKIKDSDKTLKARARNHSRDVLGDDTIQTNLDMGATDSVAKNLLNNKGERRRKIDDL